MKTLKDIKGVIFDMDGVVWRSYRALPGVPEIFHFLKSVGIGYVFATNNSSRTPEDYVEKLQALDIPVSIDQILSSAIATAKYLREHYPDKKSAYVIGGEGLYTALRQEGFEITTEQADLLVAGLDRDLTYSKLRDAAYQIQGGAMFVGTNGDLSYPETHGFAPGAGSILAAIEAATGTKPLIPGKPEKPMFEVALQLLDIPLQAAVMIGDRLETDILGANQMGMESILVLTGVSSPEKIQQQNIQPDLVIADLNHLIDRWRSEQ